MDEDPMMKWFRYDHLPPHLQRVSKIFHTAADQLTQEVPLPGRERTVAMRKLLEAKDAAVRAKIESAEEASKKAP